MPRKPSYILDQTNIEKLVEELPAKARAQKVDAERDDLAIVFPALTWAMRLDDNKWVTIPGPVHDARKFNREAALAQIDRIKEALRPAPPPQPEPEAPKTLLDAINRLEDRRFRSKRAVGASSQKTYFFWLRHLREWKIDGRLAINLPLGKISEGDCEDLSDELSDRPPTHNKVMSFLRSTFRGAIAKDWTFKNPALDILALPVDPFEPILMPADYDKLYPALLEIAESGVNPAAWVLLLVANTGCRTYEAAEINAREINRETGLWTIPKERMKTRRAHSFRLKTPQQLRIANAAAAWRTDIGKKNATRMLYRQLKDKLELPPSGVHALRRYVGTVIAVKHGIEVAAAHLGHKDTKITAKYVKVWSENLDAVAVDFAADLERFHKG